MKATPEAGGAKGEAKGVGGEELRLGKGTGGPSGGEETIGREVGKEDGYETEAVLVVEFAIMAKAGEE